jgi:hypothetical protein
MQHKNSLLFILVIVASITVNAQIGGNGVYQVLNVTPSARIAALGGNLITAYDRDVNIAFQNPAMLNKSMDGQLALNYLNYFADINQGYFAYAKHYDSVGTFAAGIQYLNYGQFTATDEAANVIGTFTASDVVFQLGYGRTQGRWAYGTNMKFVYSQLETYNSLGVAFDIAGAYVNTDKLFTATLVARNIGTQIVSYVPGNNERLPFEIQLGVSKKLEHAPFRFSLIAHNLQRPDISYVNPNARNVQIDFATQEPIEEEISTGDKIMRHIIVGTEMVFSKNFNIRLAYNHQRRREMSLPDNRGFTGFSWGFSLKLFKMNVSYGNAGFFPRRGSHHFSLLIDTKTFFKKKTKEPLSPPASVTPQQ